MVNSVRVKFDAGELTERGEIRGPCGRDDRSPAALGFSGADVAGGTPHVGRRGERAAERYEDAVFRDIHPMGIRRAVPPCKVGRWRAGFATLSPKLCSHLSASSPAVQPPAQARITTRPAGTPSPPPALPRFIRSRSTRLALTRALDALRAWARRGLALPNGRV